MTLDETYARVLMGIDEEKWEYAHRLLQCLTVARRPLHAKELAEVLAVEVGADGTPELNVNLRPADADEAVLSACSSLIVNVEADTYSDSDFYHPRRSRRVIQFSHFSVKEFLTSVRLSTFSTINVSRYYISPEPAHIVLAQSCICTLLHLDHLIDRSFTQNLPLAEYAAPNWFHHVQSGGVSPQVEDGMKCLFDPEGPNFMAWVSMHDVDRDTLWIGRFHHPERPQPSPLCYAAFLGLGDMVKYLVTTRRQDPNEIGCTYGASLHAAFHRGHFEIAQFLINHGADINSWSHRGSTVLHDAAELGHLDMAQSVLNLGAVVDVRDSHGASALHIASRYQRFKVVQLLLERSASVNARDNDASTPLHDASKSGHVSVVQVLLESGAEKNARDSQDAIPLLRAVQRGHLGVVKLLLRWDAGFSARRHYSTQLFDTLRSRHIERAQACYSSNSTLHLATQFQDTEVVELLLKCGVSVDVRNDDTSTPLHTALRLGRITVAKLLLRWGADVNARDKQDASPLHWAVRIGNLEIVQLLLRFGADIHTRDSNNSTPLHTASLGGNLGVVRALFEHANSRNEQVTTPVQHESQSWEQLVDAQDKFSWTPLHSASFRGRFDMARFLIDHGADTNTQNINGQTPFSIALERGHGKLARFLSGVEVEEHSNQ
jgi:ankyrin repeat protein